MLKFLLIVLIVCYLVYKVGGFLMRSLFISLGQDPNARGVNKKTRKAPGSNLNIDYIPKDEKDPNKNFGGGEYVDYEEVK